MEMLENFSSKKNICLDENETICHLRPTAFFTRFFLLGLLIRSLAHTVAHELIGQWNVFVQFSWCPAILSKEIFCKKTLAVKIVD